jgi:hypothetical protein
VIASVTTSRIASKYNKDVVLALLGSAFAPADDHCALERVPDGSRALAIQIQQWFGIRLSIRTQLHSR